MPTLFDDFMTAIKGTEKEFTKGNINRAIFMLSIPMILEMVMESLFAVVDIYFVGKIDTDAVATVGYTESVLTLIYAVSIGMSMAATAMISRRIGEKKPEEASDAAMQVIIIGVSISIVIGLLGVFFAGDILRLMGATDTVVANGINYTRIMFGGNIVIMLLFLLNAIFRGAGDASIAMRSLWLANGLNIILDPILIFGWGPIPALGLPGAAIATNIGRGVGVLFQLSILLGGGSVIRILRQNIHVDWSIIQKLLKVSAGGIWQFLIASGSWIVMMRIVSVFGSEIVAGYVFAIRIIIFTILPSWGLANAAATLVG
ncbi:MAG: MATE family efflux transporter, partial [Bacteroidota bacterium]